MLKLLIFTPVFLFFFLFEGNFSHSVRSGASVYHEVPRIKPTHELSNLYSDLPEFHAFDQRMEHFMRQWGLVGASVAIARQGQLIYAKGFGYANREQQEPVQPYHLFRVASVSKLITAVAVMRLVEAGQLALQSEVFGPDGVLHGEPYAQYLDPRVEAITIEHLLNHSAGWTTRWGDHLFIQESIARQLGQPLPLRQEDIIRHALSRRLHFTPGAHSAYNNLGYIILERVIERVSGMAYERFVRETILEPLQIHDAFIAFNFDSLRFPLEVRYYEIDEAQPVPAYDGSPQLVPKSRGGNDVRGLGAAGGWVISAVSLARFLMAIEGEDALVQTLSNRLAEHMAQPEPGFHPIGWRWVSAAGCKWRTGSFAGTSALSVVRNDGLIYVFLTNTSPWVGARFPYEVDRLMSRALPDAQHWPNRDLLCPEYLPRFEPLGAQRKGIPGAAPRPQRLGGDRG